MKRCHPMLLIVALAALGGCARASAQTESNAGRSEIWMTAAQAKQSSIEVQPFAEQPVETSILTSGRVTFDDLRVAHVFSPVTGKIVRMDGALGQRVAKGAALAVITSPDVGQSSADLGKANADLIAAEHDYKRKKELLSLKAVAAADYEASEDTYRQAKAEKARAEQKMALFRLGGADAVNQTYTLTAPIDGEVIARMANPGIEIQGQYANAGNVVELYTIGELDRVWVFVDIQEDDVARIQSGAKVSISVPAFPGRTFDGNVDWIPGSLDPATRTARVRCTFPNPDRLLKPEMYATVRISASERRAPAVPRSAILHLGEQAIVYVEAGSDRDKTKYERLPVAADERVDGDFVPISHGLEPGMKVVSAGAKALFDMR